jgi:hypothetical protein
MNNKKIVGGVITMFLGVFLIVFAIIENSSEEDVIAEDVPESSVSDQETNSSNLQSTIDSELFSSTITYRVPQALSAKINVSISINQDGSITSVDNFHIAEDSVSEAFQESFEASIHDLVVGQRIEDVDLTRVGGASLTTEAFMDALNSIESEIAQNN